MPAELTASDIDRLAEEIIGLQDRGAMAAPLTERIAGFDLDAAYAVAREVLSRREQRGWRRIGRKVGFTNRTIWDQYGVYRPIFGYMYAETVRRCVTSQGSPCELSLDALVQPLIEPEIVFRLRASPPATDDPAALLDAVEWVGHGFEIVQCHFPDWKFQAPDTVADGGLHGRYVVGPGLPVRGGWRELAAALANCRAVLLKDGTPVAEGGGELVLGSPVAVLAHLVRVLAGLPGHPALEAGELVTTGTLTAALPVAPGETWETRLEGLPFRGFSLRLV